MLPLFYQNPVSLDSSLHRNLSLKRDFGFNFAKGVNAVPVNIFEFPELCHVYPIAFSPDENALPVAILGLRDNENLFVDTKGRWDQVYIPAYVRRYPFIFGEMPDSEKLTLCVDFTTEIIVEDNSQLFFDVEGKPTELASNALEFCKSYHSAVSQTSEFSKLLIDLDMLTQREAKIDLSDGSKINFSGFKIIDEEKFASLNTSTFNYLRDQGYLAWIYAHLFSGSKWRSLAKRLDRLSSHFDSNFILPKETVLDAFESLKQNNTLDSKGINSGNTNIG